MLEKLLTCSIVIGLSYDSYYKCKKIYNIKRQSSDLPKIEQYMHLSQKEINKLNNKTFEKLRHDSIFVSTDLYLFNISLKENLLMGKQDISSEQLNAALKYACLENLVKELPYGIDSSIGINGDSLSLGQRQRVILARLFLENPKLILLDEVTANLDLELEAKIMENIYSYIDKDSILILISHRKPLSTKFNKSYKLNNGFLNQLDNIYCE